MVAKRDRTAEEGYNKFGSKMIIKKYKDYMDMDVYFPEYNWVLEHARYDHFKEGNIKCPYEPRYYGVGYLGEGEYKVRENGKLHRYYIIWHDMLKRCYDPKVHEREPTYEGCTVEDYLLNFMKDILHIKNVK